MATIISLSSLDGTNGFQLAGVAVNDFSGVSVSGAGDVNGDGFEDLIVGATRADSGGGDAGAAYVVFGKSAGFASSLNLSALDGMNGFRLDGAAGDNAGVAVSDAGDVNGDGFRDLIVGAYFADPNGLSSGASYVVFGRAAGFAASIDLSALDGTNGFKLNGVAAFDQSGSAVSTAGDVNGDGTTDLIIGASFADPHGSASGASYVLFGQSAGFAAAVNLSTLDGVNGFRVAGTAANERLGGSVSGAGDVNGDGIDDLVVGADGASFLFNGSGAAYVIFGKSSGFASSIDRSALDGTNGFRLEGAASGDSAGFSVSGAGDVNGDGFGDLIVGAWGADPNGGNSGASYVVFGKSSGFASSIVLSTLDGADGFRLDGGAEYDFSGFSVSGAGDVNGDGFDDLIVGAWAADPNGQTSGASYVVFGKAAGFAASINLATLDDTSGFRIDGAAADDHSGFSVSGAGDVNGDGFDDVIIGANGAGPNGAYSGASYAVFGRPSSLAVIPGTAGNDALTGAGSDETLVGGNGNDTLNGGAGDDRLDGGNGIDTAIFVGNRGDYAVDGTAGTVSGLDGADILADVERLQFADKKFALDLAQGEAAGNTVRIIGAALDAPFIVPQFVRIGIDLFDSGTSVLAACELVIGTALFQSLAGSSSNEAFVNLVFQNVAGFAPSEAQRAVFVGLLQGSGGGMTQAQLLELAANHPLNAVNINLVGLEETGVEFA